METLKKKKKSANIAHAEQTDQLLSKNIWDDVESVSKHAVLIKLKTIAWSFSEPCLCEPVFWIEFTITVYLI